MSFDTRERSLSDGQPIRLYTFSRGALRWLYCTADRDIPYQNQIFKALAISDDGIRQTGEASADAITITAPWNSHIAQQYRGMPPSSEITLTIGDLHYGETDAIVSWIGSISGVKWPAPDRCEITCQSLTASFDRPGLNLTFQRSCPHSLFDRNCRVNRDLYKTLTTVQSVTGAAISSGAFASFPDDYFSGGFIEWAIGSGEIERRGVEKHTGSDLTLLGGTDGVSLGLSVTVFPGCPQIMAICDSRFNNKDNYGGIRHMPGKSPFHGDPIF
jgi:uncharacterized phage protein (TIGR02218 family)